MGGRLSELGCVGMPSWQKRRQEDKYFQVMRLLQENPVLTQRELALPLGISVEEVNDGLKMLIDQGWVKMQNFG